MKFSSRQFFDRLLAKRLESAAIPYHHRAAAVFARWNSSFKINVGNRVILYLDREVLLPFEIGKAFGNGPRSESSLKLKAEVIMQPGGGVLLNNKSPTIIR